MQRRLLLRDPDSRTTARSHHNRDTCHRMPEERPLDVAAVELADILAAEMRTVAFGFSTPDSLRGDVEDSGDSAP